MKKSQINKFYSWSAEFVVAHGLWRKSRGCRPSMSFMGERNPKKAFELAMQMTKDMQFEDVVIKKVGDDSFTREDGWLFGIQEGWEIVPKPGDIARFYGRGIGWPARGLFINGVKIFYRTEEQQAEEHAKWVRQYEEDQKTEFEKNKASLDEKYKNLPEVFQRRIDKFRTNNPDFRWKYESYEMFCCEQAVIIATAIGRRLFSEIGAKDMPFDEAKENIINRAPSAFKEFYDMSWGKEKELVPDFADEHSGNTFWCSVMLACLYVSDQLDYIVKLHGALAQLVGSEEYGCIART